MSGREQRNGRVHRTKAFLGPGPQTRGLTTGSHSHSSQWPCKVGIIQPVMDEEPEAQTHGHTAPESRSLVLLTPEPQPSPSPLGLTPTPCEPAEASLCLSELRLPSCAVRLGMLALPGCCENDMCSWPRPSSSRGHSGAADSARPCLLSLPAEGLPGSAQQVIQVDRDTVLVCFDRECPWG